MTLLNNGCFESYEILGTDNTRETVIPGWEVKGSGVASIEIMTDDIGADIDDWRLRGLWCHLEMY
jgi:hypothetical protein